jgi:hypothetical protein
MNHWLWLLDWWVHHHHHLHHHGHLFVPSWPRTPKPPETCTLGGVCTG